MKSNSIPNGKWGADLQEAMEYRENYAKWRKGLEEAKRTQPLPLKGGRVSLVGWLRAMLKKLLQ